MQDLTKRDHQILTDLINQSNANNPRFHPYEYGVLQFRNVEALPAGSARNTTIQVTDMSAPNESDWMSLYYDRVSLTRPLHRVRPTMKYDPAYTTVHAMLDDINDRFRISLTEDDVENDEITFDPEDDEFPYTLAIRTTAASKIFFGTATLDLIDPDSGLGIVNDVVRDVIDDADGPWVTADNAELKVSLRPLLDSGDEPFDHETIDDVEMYSLEVADNDNWNVAGEIVLINPINGEILSDLYTVRAIIETHGDQNYDLRLFKEGSNYVFRSQDRGIAIAATVTAAADGLGEKLEFTFRLSDFPATIAQESKNTAGAALGTYRAILIAERLSGEVEPVSTEFTLNTTVTANVSATFFQTGESLQLVDSPTEDYLLPFMLQVHVTGPTGIPVTLPADIPVTVTLPSDSDFEPSSVTVSGIVLNNAGTSKFPAGLAKGVYELNCALMVEQSRVFGENEVLTLEIEFENLHGVNVGETVSWNVLAPIVATEDPSVDSPPELAGIVELGETLTITPGTYSGTEPLTINRTLIITDNDSTVIDIIALEDLEQLTIEVTEEMVGYFLQIREDVSNSEGAVYATSSTLGPEEGPSGELSIAPFEIVWDPDERAFRASAVELVGEWLSADGTSLADHGTTPGPYPLPLEAETVFRWTINGDTMYRDFYAGEGADTGLLFYAADEVLGHELLGAELELRVSVRYRSTGPEVDPPEYGVISGITDIYTVPSKLWGDVERPVITAVNNPGGLAEGDPLDATFTPAVFANFVAGDTINTYWESVNLAENTSHSNSGADPTYDLDDGKTVFVVRQDLVPAGVGVPTETTFSAPFSTIAEEVGQTPSLLACWGRPRIVHAEAGSNLPPTVYPGDWDLGFLTKISPGNGIPGQLFKLPNKYSFDSSDLFSASSYASQDEGAPVAGNKVSIWFQCVIGPLVLGSPNYSWITVMAEPYTLLSHGNDGSPDIDAPTLTHVTGKNTYELEHGANLNSFSPDAVATQWISKLGGDEWKIAGFTFGSGMVPGDDLNGDANLEVVANLGVDVWYFVQAATTIRVGSTYKFSPWSNQFVAIGGTKFSARGEDMVGSGGCLVRIDDWTAGASNQLEVPNQLEVSADDVGYLIVDALYNVDGEEVFNGSVEYRIVYGNGGYPADSNGDTRHFFNGNIPGGVNPGYYRADVSIYDSSDVLIETVSALIRFNEGF